MIRGCLTVHLQEAELMRDVKKIGKMNVFVQFEHKTATHISPICESEGKKPSWENCHFDFLIKDNNDTIQMNVYSKNILKNKEVGKSLLWVINLIREEGADFWAEITHNNKPAGRVKLRCQWS